MIKFLKLSIYIFLSIVMLAYGLDWFYTYSYHHPIHARNKPSYAKKFDDVKFDYALFGSSRCIYHLNPMQINKKTGLTGVNLGYSASSPFEIKLMVQEFLKNQSPKKIFIQIGDRYNQIQPDTLASVAWMPFLSDEYVSKEFYKWSEDPDFLYYDQVPFYRYVNYESKLGIRNVALSFFKNSNFEPQLGFSAITNGKKVHEKPKTFYTLEDEKNPHLEEIINFCESKQVEVYFFTAPFYRFSEENQNQVLIKYLTNYSDFSTLYDDPALFSDRDHLNYKGAEKFTELFINEYF